MRRRICRICAGTELILKKKSDLSTTSSRDFAITDSNYGKTGAIYQCADCGFLQCSDFHDVVEYYRGLEDPEYDEGYNERALQQKKLLYRAQRYKRSGKLLDVGAGSGALVEEALKLGYKAEGLEPCRYLQRKAVARNLPVIEGVFCADGVRGHYDMITLIDIIEHVTNPVELLSDVGEALERDGIGMVVTPDVGSLMAKALGYRWWHFRVAHIGYFNCKTLNMALSRAGLKPLETFRPSWYFGGDYLLERVNRYVPVPVRLPVPRLLKRITLPLNLFDSLCVIFGKNYEH